GGRGRDEALPGPRPTGPATRAGGEAAAAASAAGRAPAGVGCPRSAGSPLPRLGFGQGGPDGPALAQCFYGAVSRAVKTSVGLVLEVGVTLLLAGAQSPPVGKTCPPTSSELQFVFTKSAWNPPPLGCSPS